MRRAILITVLVALVAVALTGCQSIKPLGSNQITGVPGDTPNAAGDPAKKAVCLQNEQTFEGQVSAWAAGNPDTAVPGSLEGLKTNGVVTSVPTCPNGGTYTWNGSTLTCSVDGHWQ